MNVGLLPYCDEGGGLRVLRAPVLLNRVQGTVPTYGDRSPIGRTFAEGPLDLAVMIHGAKATPRQVDRPFTVDRRDALNAIADVQGPQLAPIRPEGKDLSPVRGEVDAAVWADPG